jgi:hypothetical protein
VRESIGAEPAPRRLAYLDRIKVVVIAGVIVGHGWGGYDALGGWVYSDVREASLSPPARTLSEVVLGPFALFAMGLMFLIAGMLTPGSVERKGRGRFARERLRLLGLPLLIFTFVLWPPIAAYLGTLRGLPLGTPAQWLAHTLAAPDPAHLWFLEVLLIFSIGYAVWHRPPPQHTRELTLRWLLVLAAGIAASSFVVRIRYPLDSDQYAQLHLNQWPQYIALFAFGAAAARHHWLDPVPPRLARQCGRMALIGVAAIGVIAMVIAAAGVSSDDFLGGPHPAAVATAAAEGLLAATVPIWLLGLAQRHSGTSGGRLARTAYAAFLVQGYVLIAIALVLRGTALPAEMKAGLVALLGVPACFAAGALLLAMVPWLARGRAVPRPADVTPADLR